MSAPTTGTGLLIVVLFLLPGAVYGLVFERLHGPIPGLEIGTRLLRAVAVSTLLNAVYVWVYGRKMARQYTVLAEGFTTSSSHGLQTVVDRAYWFGGMAFALLFLIPAALAFVVHLLGLSRMVQRIPLDFWNSTPGAWDIATSAVGIPRYVRVLTKDGEWVGGAMWPGSFMTSWPAPKEIFIAQAWTLRSDGSFAAVKPVTGGVYVRCEEVRAVEFLVTLVAPSGPPATP